MNDNRPWWQKPRVQYAGIALLVALLVFVVFLLPRWVTPVKLDPAEIEAAIEAPSPNAQHPAESPFADAQLARERKRAQAILNKVINLQDRLESERVKDWAGVAYQAALDTAMTADELYRQREFSAAQANYQSALEQLQALADQSTEILTQQLSLGQAALQNKQSADAIKAFQLALAIAPENQEAQQGLASAEVQTELLSLLRKGRQAEKTNHWQDALNLYQQALTLDANAPLAQEALQQLRQKIRDRDFNSAMSRGFKALDAGQFEAARKAFKQALDIKPGDKSVSLALKQVANQSTQASIQVRVKQAQAAERDERWQEANRLYRSVLDTDPTVVEAMVGKLRTNARAALDQRTNYLLAHPLELNQADKMAAAESLLHELEQLKDNRPKINQQRKQVAALLQQAKQPRQVLFRSDNLTQVTVYHVGRLGAFSEQIVDLKPGSYVAVGSRQGYRDIRKEFVVGLNDTQVTVDIRATEKLSLSGR